VSVAICERPSAVATHIVAKRTSKDLSVSDFLQRCLQR
jgi:hypothetical protein